VEQIEIRDGSQRGDALVDESDLLLVTGSTAANGTLDDILAAANKRGVPVILFGVTGAAIAYLSGLRRLCFRSR
jgi:uncharacterized protein (DUF4213/DUF364 family)